MAAGAEVSKRLQAPCGPATRRPSPPRTADPVPHPHASASARPATHDHFFANIRLHSKGPSVLFHAICFIPSNNKISFRGADILPQRACDRRARACRIRVWATQTCKRLPTTPRLRHMDQLTAPLVVASARMSLQLCAFEISIIDRAAIHCAGSGRHSQRLQRSALASDS